MTTSTNLRKNFDVRGITLVGMPKSRGKFSGVYMIGNVYIGASNYVLKRIKIHYNSYRRNLIKYNQARFCNDRIYNYFRTCELLNIKPRVYLLSEDPFMEKECKEEMQMPIGKFEKLYHQMYK